MTIQLPYTLFFSFECLINICLCRAFKADNTVLYLLINVGHTVIECLVSCHSEFAGYLSHCELYHFFLMQHVVFVYPKEQMILTDL